MIVGADIHAYIEYASPYNPTRYTPFGGKLFLPRDYYMFGLLAGVRMQPDGALNPKGIPNNLAWEADGDYYLRVTDKYVGEGHCTTEQAEKYLKAGSNWKDGYGPDSDYPQITHPDWHSASWMIISELVRVYSMYLLQSRSPESILYSEPRFPDPAWRAMLSAMHELPEPRLVFWFDN